MTKRKWWKDIKFRNWKLETIKKETTINPKTGQVSISENDLYFLISDWENTTRELKNQQKQKLDTSGTINGKTLEEVLGKDWKEKFINLKGDEIIKERDRLKRLIDKEKFKEHLKTGIKRKQNNENK